MKITKKLSTLALLVILFMLSSCSDDTPECEMSNTGTIIIENTRSKGTVQVFFNKTGTIAINGPGNLNIPSGEKASIELPAGQHNVKARLSISSCSGNRCQISTSGLPEKNVDLSSCDDFNLSY